MQPRLLILLSFSLPLFFLSCSSPLDKAYTSSTYLQDIEAIKESNKISYEDMELLTKYIAVSKIAGNNLEGKTYADILEQIKDLQTANADESNKINNEKEAARIRLGSLLKVNLIEKLFSKINSKDCFTYKVTFQNLSNKNIKMVVGSISLNDLIEREIKNIEILLDEELKPGLTFQKSFVFPYNHAAENDKRIRLTDLLDLRIVWNPDKIIYEDGSIAE